MKFQFVWVCVTLFSASASRLSFIVSGSRSGASFLQYELLLQKIRHRASQNFFYNMSFCCRKLGTELQAKTKSRTRHLSQAFLWFAGQHFFGFWNKFHLSSWLHTFWNLTPYKRITLCRKIYIYWEYQINPSKNA